MPMTPQLTPFCGCESWQHGNTPCPNLPGPIRAIDVGPVCDLCATDHLAGYVAITCARCLALTWPAARHVCWATP